MYLILTLKSRAIKLKRFASGPFLFAVSFIMALTLSYVVKAEDTMPSFGDGTMENPYQISEPEHLQWLADAIYKENNIYGDKHYMLTKSIISPEKLIIGTMDEPFRGVFDGNGYTITVSFDDDFYYDPYYIYTIPDKLNIGLFGYIDSGEIKNLGVDGIIDITCGSSNVNDKYVGGIAGYNKNGEITNCFSEVKIDFKTDDANTGYVSKIANTVGGIAGRNDGGEITYCNFNGYVDVFSRNGNGNNVAGGIAGDNIGNGTISSSYSTGNVESEAVLHSYIGGIAGTNYGAIAECYATGNINGLSKTTDTDIDSAVFGGGIAGYLDGGSIADCYAAGDVTGVVSKTSSVYTNDKAIKLGGIAGSIDNGGNIKNCFATGTVSGIGWSNQGGGIAGLANSSTEVTNSVALNDLVVVSNNNTYIGRVVGRVVGVVSDVCSNNYAGAGLKLKTHEFPDFIENLEVFMDAEHGTEISPGTENGQYNNQIFWENTLGWDFTSVWEWGSALPALRNAGAVSTVPVIPPSVTEVSVSPSAASLVAGGSEQFTATVTGTGSPPQTVIWRVDGGASSNTIISIGGLLSVASEETAQKLTVVATSTADSTKSASAEVTVTPTATVKTVTLLSQGMGATGGGDYAEGTTVSIDAGSPPEGKQFSHWTSSPAVNFDDADSAVTSFIMPGSPVTVTANFEDIPAVATYAVTVNGGGAGATGGGDYAEGATVSIDAGSPPEGKQFSHWTSSPAVNFDDADSAVTSFIMPGNPVTVTANFEDIPDTEPPDAELSDYSLSINDDQRAGIIGQRRTITVTSENGAQIEGKILLIQITETSGRAPTVMAVVLRGTDAETVTVSYQRSVAVIEAWLFDGLEGLMLTGQNPPGILAHDSTKP